MLPSLLQSGRLPFPAALFPFITFAIYAYGIWSGLQVIRSQPGWQLQSMWFWLSQAPAITSSTVSFTISCGFGAWVYLRFGQAGLGAGWAAYLGSGFRWSVGKPEQVVMVGVNTFAVMLAVFLFLAAKGTSSQRAEA